MCLCVRGGTSFFLILCECTATSSIMYFCKLFASNICVNQDGVPFMNPLVATPNIWWRNPGIQRFRNSGTVHLLRNWVRSNFISWHSERGNSLKEKEGIRHTSQYARDRVAITLRFNTAIVRHKQLSKRNRFSTT